VPARYAERVGIENIVPRLVRPGRRSKTQVTVTCGANEQMAASLLGLVKSEVDEEYVVRALLREIRNPDRDNAANEEAQGSS